MLTWHAQTAGGGTNMFDSLPTLTKHLRPTDELDSYLSTGVEGFNNVKDVVQWWHDHRGTYPCLSRMALDHLTIPGTCEWINES